VPRRKTGVSGLSIASLVLGIVSPFLGPIALVTGLLALVFGGISIKRIGGSPGTTGRGMAIAGMILGGLSLLLGLMYILSASVQPPPGGDSFDVLYRVVSGR